MCECQGQRVSSAHVSAPRPEVSCALLLKTEVISFSPMHYMARRQSIECRLTMGILAS